jgi:uncharacterized small protein (DUF1192 family)
MDFDDLPTKKSTPVDDLEKEDLSTYSVDQLEDRAERLAAEIERTKEDIKGKQASKLAADAFFKS